jgi:hypothetical protein
MRKSFLIAVLLPVAAFTAIAGTGFGVYVHDHNQATLVNIGTDYINFTLTSAGCTTNHTRSVEGTMFLDQEKPTCPTLKFTEAIEIVFGQKEVYNGSTYTTTYLPVAYYFQYDVKLTMTNALAKYYKSTGVTITYASEAAQSVDWETTADTTDTNGYVTTAVYEYKYESPLYTLTPATGETVRDFTQTATFTPTLIFRDNSLVTSWTEFKEHAAGMKDSTAKYDEEVAWQCLDA